MEEDDAPPFRVVESLVEPCDGEGLARESCDVKVAVGRKLMVASRKILIHLGAREIRRDRHQAQDLSSMRRTGAELSQHGLQGSHEH